MTLSKGSPARNQLYDLIVAGCGPVGATVANLLGRHGLSTLVLEAATELHPLPRAIHLDDEVLRVFQALDLHEEIGAATRPIDGMHFLDGQRRLLLEVRKSHSQQLLYGFAATNMFYQPALEAILRQGLARFPNVHLCLGWALQEIAQDANQGVTVTARSASGDEVTLQGRFLLGCDGASSIVRRLMGLRLRKLNEDQPWLVVDTRLLTSLETPDVVQQICDPQRPATYVPATGDRRRWEFMLLPGESAEEMTQPERIRELLAAHIDPEQVQVERAAVYTFHALLAERWQSGRIFLLGDAAHQMPPFLGQGMCAGIRDAHNLAWKLWLVCNGLAPDRLLQSYQAERQPHVASVIRLALWAGRIIQTRRPWLARSRDALLRAAMSIPPIRDRLRQMERTVPRLGPGCLAPANRVAGMLSPQPTVITRQSQTVLLDELLGDGFALVAVGGDSSALNDAVRKAQWPQPPPIIINVISVDDPWLPVSPVITVRDPSGMLRDWYSQHRIDLTLLRPDRYIFGGYHLDDIDRAGRELHSALDGDDKTTRVEE
jgi:3-(3-hydroxy-phenyl)propionate hydroxylase